ncbi:F-box protein At1g47810 [Capsella rubella]|uniref:F-box protein At1g47810 n=1 Tax=Capsella rubella TaxID=81985 RepID=UPI000CD4DD8B|nr:F-box protein At1g47810 [Capsella rubella]
MVFEILSRLPAKSIGRYSVDILTRLPLKSIGRFIYVSKSWANTFHSVQLIEQYPFRYASNDRRITGYQENWHFFSKPTRPGPHVAEEEKKPPPEFLSNTVCHSKEVRYKEPSYVHGLISFYNGQEQVVCNPTTGQSISLPTLNSTDCIVRSFLGYDPIHARYKVLCLTNVTRFCDHQVLTLGGAQSWRTIQCSTPHRPLGTDSVCIDGVLYYTASGSFTITEPLLIRFDLRSETLEIASRLPQGMGSDKLHETTFINYHGKVALVTQVHQRYTFTFTFTLWVLEDAKKQDWSIQRLSFSLNGTDRQCHSGLKMLGVSETGEFVYAPNEAKELQGNTEHKFRDFDNVFTFLHHVESLMFI